VLQRAHDLADRLGGHAGIERRGVELGVRPSSTWITRTSMFCSSRWVAKLCRKVCSETRLSMSAIRAAVWQKEPQGPSHRIHVRFQRLAVIREPRARMRSVARDPKRSLGCPRDSRHAR
jgi:hypothetical protein